MRSLVTVMNVCNVEPRVRIHQSIRYCTVICWDHWIQLNITRKMAFDNQDILGNEMIPEFTAITHLPMTQIRSLKKLLSDTQTSPFEFALIFKVRSMIVERRVMIPWKPIDMSFSNPFGDQVLHLLYIYIYIYIYSVTVSTTQKGTFHFGSNIDLPLVSWLPSNSKSPSFNYENQFHSLFSSSFLGSRLLHFPFAFLLKFACHLQDIFWLHSGFLELVPCRVKHNMDVFIRVCSKEKSYQSFSS